jgi:hypothetical protein
MKIMPFRMEAYNRQLLRNLEGNVSAINDLLEKNIKVTAILENSASNF